MTGTTTHRHDGWTPERQRTFLETLAVDGMVRRACAAAEMSHEAAYNLRHRAEGMAFRLGWDAALLLARTRLADTLMERAIDGQEDVITRDPDAHVRTRHRHDNRLALSLLARLDRFADDGHAAHGDARLIAGDWAAFLDLVADGHGDSAVALFLAARRPEAADENAGGPCQLRGGGEGEPDAAYPLSVWRDDELGTFRTNFPPAPDFTGDQWGKFAIDWDYERGLTVEETTLMAAAADVRDRLDRARGEARRAAWFDNMRAIAEGAAQCAAA